MYWLCFKSAKGVCVVLQPAGTLIHARLRAQMDGLAPGEFVEGHQLDAGLIRRIPKDMVGKCLSAAQARRLLAMLDGAKGRARKRA